MLKLMYMQQQTDLPTARLAALKKSFATQAQASRYQMVHTISASNCCLFLYHGTHTWAGRDQAKEGSIYQTCCHIMQHSSEHSPITGTESNQHACLTDHHCRNSLQDCKAASKRCFGRCIGIISGAAPGRMGGTEEPVGHAAGCPALAAPWATSLLRTLPPAQSHAPM